MEQIKIILASKSPRRRELIELMGLKCEIMPSDAEEDNNQKIKLVKLSESLSLLKAQDVFDKTSGNRVVIGSDTLVCVNGKYLGKPKNREEGFKMLKSLSGNTHKVITSLCVIIEKDGEVKTYNTHDISKVTFLKLSDETINNYLDCGEYQDKAGAYAIQGRSGMFIKNINGSFASVMGLPTHILYEILKKENLII
ncbi:MAG: septum formation protein Maf [Clostridiales bacterium]|nr:septum formation protein Maf [Clostridiales bacterium]